jgi:hypothetical protein
MYKKIKEAIFFFFSLPYLLKNTSVQWELISLVSFHCSFFFGLKPSLQQQKITRVLSGYIHPYTRKNGIFPPFKLVNFDGVIFKIAVGVR